VNFGCNKLRLGAVMPVDEEYYREVSPGSVAERLLISARNRIFQDFKALFYEYTLASRHAVAVLG
jgi:hypothetical protein